MTSTKLIDGRVMHLPAMPFITDSESVIKAPTDAELAKIAPLIEGDDLLLFTKRLVAGARKCRRSARYSEVNRARLILAGLCIARALDEG